MKSVLSARHFHDEEAAYRFLESRIWPDGPVCPHCGGVERISKMRGKSTRVGTYKCYQCRKQFRVTVKTVFEDSHVKLHLWLQAVVLLTSSKKGISANQLHRTLGVSLKTAWFMGHRIREAMRTGALAPLGGSGRIVEADETYYGPVDKPRATKTSGQPFLKGGTGPANKRPIVALIERGGKARTFHVPVADSVAVSKIVRDNIDHESRLHTDESSLYPAVGNLFDAHKTVKHSNDEYVRYEDGEVIHTNSAEGYFSLFKRGMRGIYQHCKEKHLHRYLAEFDFRYNNRIALGVDDAERADSALKGIVGKRLTYRPAH